MSSDHLHISLVQADLVWEDVDANLQHFEQLLQEVPAESDLVVLPEMFSTGFSMNVAALAESMDGKTIVWMKQQAFKLNKVIAGSVMIRDDNHFFNRFVFAHPSGEMDYYDKRHLFSMGGENLHFTAGAERKVFELKSFRVLPLVCYDLRFPVFSRNRNDYDLIINCSNWPSPRREVWQTLLKARAIENQAYVAGVNRIGIDPTGIRYSGDSLIVDPKGNEIVAANPETDQVITAKLSLLSLRRFRKSFPVLPDADDFQLNI